MTKIAPKGAALKLSISAVYTTIAQNREFTGPDAETQTYDATTLDGGVGMAFKPTGYVNGGTVSGSLLFDPVDSTHQAMTDLLTTPAVASWKCVWSDAALTEWAFTGVLTKFTPKVSLTEGLVADYEIKLDGIPTYPT